MKYDPILEPEKNALFLDLDGTIASIQPHPDAVFLDRSVLTVLRQLRFILRDRLAIISGRSVENLQQILGDTTNWLAGVHGLECTDGKGGIIRAEPAAGMTEARRSLYAFAAEHPEIYLEDKGSAIALHYRLAPDLAENARIAAETSAQENDLAVQTGKMVIEIRAGRDDKGCAIRKFMQKPTFLDAKPVFVGDDETDESGFAVCAELGGYGVLVGAERVTRARYRLLDVAAVHDWLQGTWERFR